MTMNIHTKKNIIFTFYIIFNLFLVFVLFFIKYGYLFVALFLFASHIRDVLSILIQIINIKSIIKKNPEIQEEEKNVICSLIPVYAEQIDLVKKNIDSLTSQNLSKNTKNIIFIICDGLIIREPNNKSLFDYLDDIITYKDNNKYEYTYTCWKTKVESTLFYKVGKYKNVDIILSYKNLNLGKKDSLIVGEKFIEDIQNIQNYNDLDINKVDFIYHTDSDTIADKDCLNHLLKSLVADKTLDGVSGIVRAYYNEDTNITGFWKLWEKSFFIMQDFQYFFSLIIRRLTESLFKSTVCLPGCINMIRINEKSKYAINKYTNLPQKDTNILQTVTRNQGTDRRYTTLLLKQGANLKMNWRAFCYTEPPLSIKAFINQRRRWSSNAFFNSIILLYSSNIPLYIKFSILIDIMRLFSTILRIVSYFAFWFFINKLTLFQFLFLGVFLIFPYLYIFIWILIIIPDRFRMFIGFIFNKIYMPILAFITITKMFFTLTNFAWGNENVLEENNDLDIISENEENKMETIIEEDIVDLDIISENEENEENKIEIIIK